MRPKGRSVSQLQLNGNGVTHDIVLAGNTMTWMDLIETEVIPKLHEHATSTEIVLKLAMTWKDAMPS